MIDDRETERLIPPILGLSSQAREGFCNMEPQSNIKRIKKINKLK